MMLLSNLKRLGLAILLSGSLGILPALASGDISSSELINNPAAYDGKQVAYKGEVIGEVMRRGDFSWLNLRDAENAIGVWAPLSLAKDVVYRGSYKARGDIFEITGVFHRSCPEHGGDLDIHAQAFKKIESGRLIPKRASPDKIKKASILGGVLLLVWILMLLFRK